MGFFEAIILAIVEGLTEFLPISSTGHLILVERLLQVPQTEFVKTFTIAVQLGAIAAVIGLYARSSLFKKEIVKRLIVAFIPTGVVGLLLYKTIKMYLLGNTAVVLWSLGVGGVLLIGLEYWLSKKETHEKSIADLTLPQAGLVGVCQAASVIPGVSRAAATIIGGRALQLSRRAAVEFSFLLAVPTMLAATGLDAVKTGWHFTGEEWLLLLVGCIAAYGAALLAVRYLLRFIQTHTFVAFGVYRILLAAVLWFVLY